MKHWVKLLLLALALGVGTGVQAQTFEQSVAADARGDYRTAFTGYRKLAEEGNRYAQYNLSQMYDLGQGVPKDERQAFVWARKSAEQGFDKAQSNLGVMYFNGQGVPKDEQQAVVWFRKAAEQGEAAAQVNLGLAYGSGHGVTKDDQQAVEWFRKGAEQGSADGQSELGLMYSSGRGVPKDEKQAVMWYSKAAEQGDARAQSNLGLSYVKGRGVPKDGQQAVVWFRKAADQGNVVAQMNLANMYDTGDGVPRNDQQAVRWFRVAAEQGDSRAQFNLGNMYWNGRGVDKDEQQAYFWWLLASSKGYPEAVKNRDIAEGNLTSRQRVAVQTAARDWRPKSGVTAFKEPSQRSNTVTSLPSQPAPAAAVATGPNSTGSGFRITNGAVVTNHHVIEGCSRLRVNGVVAQLRGSDARSDLALINVDSPGQSASLRAQRAAVGESVAVAGFPLRGLLSGFNMTTGSLSSLSGIGGDTRLLQITAPVQPGNSGGPMLDSAGNLMGVVVSKLDAIKAAKLTGDIPQNVNFAINANVLRSFLDANSVGYETASSDKAIPTTAIADKAKGFTVLVECWK
jgi:TPR repeat protein